MKANTRCPTCGQVLEWIESGVQVDDLKYCSRGCASGHLAALHVEDALRDLRAAIKNMPMKRGSYTTKPKLKPAKET